MEEISKDEIRAALKQMKDRAAPGGDNIKRITKCRHETNTVQYDMGKGRNTEPIEGGSNNKNTKKGHLTKCVNWTAITLLPTVSKIIARILLRLERIKPEIGKKLRKSQAGFQVRCFRRDHIP
jgi:hypothetical protein